MTANRSRNTLLTVWYAILLLVQGIVSTASAQATADPQGYPETIQVVVVRLEGAVSIETVALVKRAVRLAESRGSGSVVLEIISRGGIGSTTEEVERLLPVLHDSPVQIVAFIRGHLYGGDAEVALAAGSTYMTSGSMLGPRDLDQDARDSLGPEEIRQLRIETAARMELSMARRGDVTAAMKVLIKGMVDSDMHLFEVTYEDQSGIDVTRVLDEGGLQALVAADRSIRHKAELGQPPISLSASDALRWGFSASTIDSLDELIRDELNVPIADMYRILPTWSESSAAWLEGMKPILFLLGFILLIIEVKTPGLIIPGVIGVLLISLGLYSSYLTGLAEWTEIGLFFLGLCGIAVEIFILPGTMVFGALGFLSVIAALMLSQQTFIWPSDPTEHAVFAANVRSMLSLIVSVIIGMILFWRFMPHLPFFNRILLKRPQLQPAGGGTRFALGRGPSRDELLGQSGTAVTDLRPAGILELGNERLDVVTTGDFISSGEQVRILEIQGNRIIVGREDDGERGAVGLPVLVFLVVIGVLFAVAEAFFVSFGILGTCSAVTLTTSIVLAFMHHGNVWGWVFLGTSAIGSPLAFGWALKILPRTAFGKKLLLSGPELDTVTKAAEEPGLQELLGKSGRTATRLRPAGVATIGGRRIDVITRGEMIEPDTPIKVILVEGNRVVIAAEGAD